MPLNILLLNYKWIKKWGKRKNRWKKLKDGEKITLWILWIHEKRLRENDFMRKAKKDHVTNIFRVSNALAMFKKMFRKKISDWLDTNIKEYGKAGHTTLDPVHYSICRRTKLPSLWSRKKDLILKLKIKKY